MSHAPSAPGGPYPPEDRAEQQAPYEADAPRDTVSYGPQHAAPESDQRSVSEPDRQQAPESAFAPERQQASEVERQPGSGGGAGQVGGAPEPAFTLPAYGGAIPSQPVPVHDQVGSDRVGSDRVGSDRVGSDQADHGRSQSDAPPFGAAPGFGQPAAPGFGQADPAGSGQSDAPPFGQPAGSGFGPAPVSGAGPAGPAGSGPAGPAFDQQPAGPAFGEPPAGPVASPFAPASPYGAPAAPGSPYPPASAYTPPPPVSPYAPAGGTQAQPTVPVSGQPAPVSGQPAPVSGQPFSGGAPGYGQHAPVSGAPGYGPGPVSGAPGYGQPAYPSYAAGSAGVPQQPEPTAGMGLAPYAGAPTSGMPASGMPASGVPAPVSGYGPVSGVAYGDPGAAGAGEPPRRGRAGTIVAWVLVALLVLGAGGLTALYVATSNDAKRDKKNLTAQLAERDTKIGSQGTELDQLKKDLQTARDELTKVRQDLTGTQNASDELRRQKAVIVRCFTLVGEASRLADQGLAAQARAKFREAEPICEEAGRYLQ